MYVEARLQTYSWKVQDDEKRFRIKLAAREMSILNDRCERVFGFDNVPMATRAVGF